MRAKDGARLSTVRLLLAAIKQKEVDERIDLSDADVLAIIEKMVKQRRESIAQFEKASRQDLADKEKAEIEVLSAYLPQKMDQAGIEKEIESAISEASASGIKDMGKVMALLKPRLAGRADLGQVPLANAAVDVRIAVEDASGNRVQYTIEPAFVFAPSRRRAASQP